MSEETTTTDDTMETRLAEEPRQDTAEGGAEHGRSHRGTKAEAIKYRLQLRETEAERDRVTACFEAAVEQLYRQTVEHMLSHQRFKLIHPEDLKTFTGKGATDYVNDEGEMDMQGMQEDFDRLAEERPELFQNISRAPKPDPSMGHGLSSSSHATWADAFRH